MAQKAAQTLYLTAKQVQEANAPQYETQTLSLIEKARLKANEGEMSMTVEGALPIPVQSGLQKEGLKVRRRFTRNENITVIAWDHGK